MNEVVTKPKITGRVAAGKKTAELNLKRKEDLLRNQKTVPSDTDSGTEEVPRGPELSSQALYRGGAVIIVALAFGAVFLWKKRDTPAVQKQPENDIFCMN